MNVFDIDGGGIITAAWAYVHLYGFYLYCTSPAEGIHGDFLLSFH